MRLEKAGQYELDFATINVSDENPTTKVAQIAASTAPEDAPTFKLPVTGFITHDASSLFLNHLRKGVVSVPLKMEPSGRYETQLECTIRMHHEISVSKSDILVNGYLSYVTKCRLMNRNHLEVKQLPTHSQKIAGQSNFVQM